MAKVWNNSPLATNEQAALSLDTGAMKCGRQVFLIPNQGGQGEDTPSSSFRGEGICKQRLVLTGR